MGKRFNPLFDGEKQVVIASEPIQETVEGAFSPASHKPMVKVQCDGIPAYYDEENRLVLPILEKTK